MHNNSSTNDGITNQRTYTYLQGSGGMQMWNRWFKKPLQVGGTTSRRMHSQLTGNLVYCIIALRKVNQFPVMLLNFQVTLSGILPMIQHHSWLFHIPVDTILGDTIQTSLALNVLREFATLIMKQKTNA
jgi:hypothetical protein